MRCGVQGKFDRINFLEKFYVGGYGNYSLISDRTGVTGGLVGCVRRVVVNGKQYDMRRGAFIGDAEHGYDVGQSVSLSVCLSVCLSVSVSFTSTAVHRLIFSKTIGCYCVTQNQWQPRRAGNRRLTIPQHFSILAYSCYINSSFIR